MMSTADRYFDLNIEKILEGWEPRHAIRELIANALDEQTLSGTPEIQIGPDANGDWHIRDYGRGLRYEHLTQNESTEKLSNTNRVIGKFGVGLKDALATLDRRSVGVHIKSKHGEIQLTTASKHGFSDVVTLHAGIRAASDPGFIGTDIMLTDVDPREVEAAKDFFLKFAGEVILDGTPHGQILQRATSRPARIYVMGLLVAEEENFAFSYNITSLSAAMRRALNRERTNVGRTAYTDRVKAMLLASGAPAVVNVLAADLSAMEHGAEHDEVRWIDVAAHACRILNAQKKILFVTTGELDTSRDCIDFARSEGLEVVTIPDSIRKTLAALTDFNGDPVRDIRVLHQEWAQSFTFCFVSTESLEPPERDVFAKWKEIAEIGGGLSANVRELKISETMRPDAMNGDNIVGLWDGAPIRLL